MRRVGTGILRGSEGGAPHRIGGRRVVRAVFLAVSGVIFLGIVVLVVTGFLAARQLNEVRHGLPRVRAMISSGDVDGANAAVIGLTAQTREAHHLTSGPVWGMAAAVPYLGRPVKSTRGLASALDQLARTVLPDVITASGDLNPAKLRLASDSFDVSRLAAAAPSVHAANVEIARSIMQVDSLPKSTWLAPVDSARNTVVAALSRLGSTLNGIDQATQVAPAMLGATTPQRYFIGLMNDAESRGIGGMPGSFAIVEADKGVVRFVHFGSDAELINAKASIDLGADFDARYASHPNPLLDTDPYSVYIWSDISPNFPYAAELWANMWQAQTGQTITGAAALDPTALGYFLDAAGAIKAADGTTITGHNVVALTESELYARFPAEDQNTQRKDYLNGISELVDDKILSTNNTKGLLAAAGESASQRRLLIWSASPAIEKILSQTNLSGVIPATDAPFIGPVITSATGNKLDYYIERTADIQRAGCGATRQVTAAITVSNTAPASGLPPYVTIRLDEPTYKTQPGDQRDDVSYFATAGATLQYATLDGKRVAVSAGQERGHPTFLVDAEIPHGQSRVVVFHLTEPAGTGAPIVLKQPAVNPISVTVTSQRCH
jgi:hypothetical protein